MRSPVWYRGGVHERRAVTWLALAVMVAVIGCSDPAALVADAGSGPDAGPIPDAGASDGPGPDVLAALCGASPQAIGDWEDCFQRRKCDWDVGCVSLTPYTDVAECVARADDVEGGRLAAERRERERAVAEGRAAVDPVAFGQCLVETSAAHCSTALFHPACLTRFVGTIDDGEQCFTDVECASPGATCARDCADACCAGACRPQFAEGETYDERRSCEPGMQCNRTCIRGDIDTPCASDRDCDGDAWCNPERGMCEADFPAGAVCTNLLQCGGDTSCVGLGVRGGEGRCLRISEPGDACDFLCYGNLHCDFSGPEALGQCAPLLAPGAACGDLIPCLGIDYTCHQGRCVLAAAANETCGDLPCRPGLFCSGELGDRTPACEAPRADGQPCTRPGHCASHLCSGSAEVPGQCLPWADRCPTLP
jgi:hypothetical protein